MLHGRVQRVIGYLKERYFFTDSYELSDFYFSEGQQPIDKVNEGDWRRFEKGEYWGKPEYYCRFKHSFDVPASFKGKNVFYEILPEEGHPWDRKDVQFIIIVNGQIMQGGDSNHRAVKLLDCAEGGEHYDIMLCAYLDKFEFKGAHKVMNARLCSIDEAVVELIFDMETAWLTTKYYGPDDSERVFLLRHLNEAVNLLVMDTQSKEEFDDSVKKATAYLQKNVYGKTTVDAVISCIGHTHIDLAWLWRIRQTREKGGRSFATVLKLMEEYPEYRFMSSQAQLYEFIKEDYPELYERIKEAVKRGQWEVEGSAWVEPDTNVPSGESLVRQFLIGKRFFKQEFGVDTKIFWEPDVFGYSAVLPQIIKKSGIDYFFTSKLSWSEFNRVPYDTFMWKGIDGTEVLSHFLSSTPLDDSKNFFSDYNGELAPPYVIGGWNRYANKDLNNNTLFTFGFGDGGGGPSRNMLEFARRMNKGLPGCPKVQIEPSLDFFRRLEKDVKGKKHLPKWMGELYLEFHRGTLTSQAANKRNNRKSEIAMHDLETLSTLAKLELNKEYPTDVFTRRWKNILLHQFHDILPGSSINEVYEDSDKVYAELSESNGRDISDTLDALTKNITTSDNSLVVFNTLGMARSEVVITDMPKFTDFAITDANGREMKWQKTFDGKLCFLAEKVPAKGYKVFTVVKGEHKDFGEIYATNRVFRNKYIKVKFDKNMNIASLYHKAADREVAPAGGTINRLVAYEDLPFNHEAWDIKANYAEQSWNIDDVQSAELVEKGAVRCVYRVVRKFRSTEFVQYIIGYADNDRIDVKYDFDWKETHILVKVENDVDVNATRATYDIQFGSIERTAHENTLWDFAQFEVCGHKWIDQSDNGFGFSLLNDSKYGHRVKDGKVETSLIRSAMWPCKDQDKGQQHIETALYPHKGAVSESDVYNQAYSLNFPLYCVKADKNTGKTGGEYSLVSADKSNIIIETVKMAEDSDEIVIRMYENRNKDTACTLTLNRNIKSAAVTNLLEEEEEKLVPDDNELTLKFKPFEIKTVKVRL